MVRSVPLLVGIVTSIGLFACSIDDLEKRSIASHNLGIIELTADAGAALPDSSLIPPDSNPTPPPPCNGQSASVAPKPGVTAVICTTSTGSGDDPIGSYTVTASFQIDGSYFGSAGIIVGSLGLDAILTTDDLGNSSMTIVDETSGQWTRDGITMTGSEFAILWSAVAPGQLAPSPGGFLSINATVAIQDVALAIAAVAVADPCQADANNLDAAATNYNWVVGGSIAGAAAIGLLEIPSWGTATGGFFALSTAVITAKVAYNAACKNFQLCCKNNNWPAGVCRPKGAKRRGCKNDG